MVNGRGAVVIECLGGAVEIRRALGHVNTGLHSAVSGNGPLYIVVVGGTAAVRQEQDLLHVLLGVGGRIGRRPLVGGDRVWFRGLGPGTAPAAQVGGGHYVLAAIAWIIVEPDRVIQVVLREIPGFPGEQFGLQRGHGGESPAGAAGTLVPDRRKLAVSSQIIGSRVTYGGDRFGGGRSRLRVRLGRPPGRCGYIGSL